MEKVKIIIKINIVFVLEDRKEAIYIFSKGTCCVILVITDYISHSISNVTISSSEMLLTFVIKVLSTFV